MTEARLLLADTMIVTWYVLDPARLPVATSTALEDETDRDNPISVSAYSLLELVYMSEKKNNGITVAELEQIREVLDDPEGPFAVVPMDAAAATGAGAIPREFVTLDGTDIVNADPGDRVIAATALSHDLTVVTSDHKIHGLVGVVSGLRALWDAELGS